MGGSLQAKLLADPVWRWLVREFPGRHWRRAGGLFSATQEQIPLPAPQRGICPFAHERDFLLVYFSAGVLLESKAGLAARIARPAPQQLLVQVPKPAGMTSARPPPAKQSFPARRRGCGSRINPRLKVGGGTRRKTPPLRWPATPLREIP